MKRIYSHIFFLAILLIFTGLNAHAQCCPVKEKVGARDQFLYEYDNITLTQYTSSDEYPDDWCRYNGGNQAPSNWTYNKFIVIEATTSRSTNTDKYIRLCFWCGNNYSGRTRSYTNGLGPVPGDYTVTLPMMGYFDDGYDAIAYWTQTTMPSSNKPMLMGYRVHSYWYTYAGQYNYYWNQNMGQWVFSLSSYASSQAGPTIFSNSVGHITSFNNLTVTVAEGDNGNLYIQIGGQDCNSNPAVTIGTRKDNNVNKLTTTVVGNGSVTTYPDCEYHTTGETVTLTPTPANTNTCFKGWTGDDASYVTDNGNGTYRLTMQARDMNVTANFGSCTIEATEDIKLCANEVPFDWNDNTYFSSATADYTCKSKVDPTVDSITHLVLTVFPMPIYGAPEDVTICEKELPYTWDKDGKQYTKGDTYEYVEYHEGSTCVKAAYTLNLKVNPVTYGTATKWICSNTLATEGYTWWGTTYHSVPATPPTHTYQHPVYDCDSIVTLDLQVCYADTLYDTIRVCSLSDFSYNWSKTTDGVQHKTSADLKNYNIRNTTAQIADSVKGVKMECLTVTDEPLFCDSIWYLVVLPQTEPQLVTETENACECVFPDFEKGEVWEYTFNKTKPAKDQHIIYIGDTAKAEKSNGNYIFRDTLRSAGGCDSVRYMLTLNVVRPEIMPTQTVEQCDDEVYSWILPGKDMPSKEEFEMMTEPKLYYDTIFDAAGCAKECYTLNLIVHPTYTKPLFGINGSADDHRIKLGDVYINKGETFRCGNHDYDTPGEHEEKTKTSFGCDSVILFNLVVLDNVGHIYETICEGEEYPWYKAFSAGTETDTVCKTKGDYPFHTKTVFGTDSIAILHLSVIQPERTTDTRTVCAAELPFMWNDIEISSAADNGKQAQRKSLITGCDSIVTLNLNVITPEIMPVQTVEQCDDEVYSWILPGKDMPSKEEFEMMTEPKLYYDTIFSDDGCALQCYTLNLIVHPTYKKSPFAINGSTDDRRIKLGNVYINQGEKFHCGNNDYDTPGEHEEKTKTMFGCDSVILFNLVVLDNIGHIYENICEGEEYPWYKAHSAGTETDTVCKTNGDYSFYTKTVFGTDSVAILHLTVTPTVYQTDTRTVCAAELPFMWNDIEISSAADNGKQAQRKSLITGCDSIVTLNLNVITPEIMPVQTVEQCDDEVYSWILPGREMPSKEEFEMMTEQKLYYDTIFSEEGCALQCYTLNLIVHPTYKKSPFAINGSVDDRRIKLGNVYINKGDKFHCGNNDYDTPGEHEEKTKTIFGCDSVILFNLVVLDNIEHIYATLCGGEEYPWYKAHSAGTETDTICKTTGDYSFYTKTVFGTDSIAILHLSVVEAEIIPEEVVDICDTDPFDWIHDGDLVPTREEFEMMTESGVYHDTIWSAESCPLKCYTLKLNVHESYTKPLFAINGSIDDRRVHDRKDVCENAFPFTWNGIEITGMEQNGVTAKLQTVKYGCDSVVILDLNVIPVSETSETVYKCQSEFPFMWNGIEIKNQTQNGAKVTLESALTHCDSIVTLDLQVTATKYGTDEVVKCATELPFMWNGNQIRGTQDNGKVAMLTSSAGCDSVVTLVLTIAPSYDNITDGAVICYNELADYTWEGYRFADAIRTNTGETQTATYTQTLKTAQYGCDSTVTFTLTVHPTFEVEDGASICSTTELPYKWQGSDKNGPFEVVFQEQGSVTKPLQTVHGCDSVVTFTLTVLPAYNAEPIAECTATLPYEWRDGNGQLIETLTSYGTKSHTLRTVEGCDSVVTIVLNRSYTNSTDSRTICASELPYRWEGETFNAAGSKTKTLKSKVSGCDSVVTFTLNVNQTYDISDGITVCEGSLPYVWRNGKTGEVLETFNSDGTRRKTLKTVNGCDSVVTFTLKVQRPVRMPLQKETVCVDKMPFLWEPWQGRYREYSQGGLYGDTIRTKQGCDSIIYSLELTVYTTQVTGSANVVNQTICPDNDDLMIDFAYTDGRPVAYELVFDEAAQKQDFQNITGNITRSNMRITVPIPHDPMQLNSYPAADDYNITLRVTDWCDRTTDYPLSFTMLYPASLIRQKWNDVLAVYNEKYNGGMTFSSIRWFHEGSQIESNGDNNSYIYVLPELRFGEAYWVELTRADDGKTFRTCPFYPERKQDGQRQNTGERIRLSLDKPDNMRAIRISSELSGEYIVYDVTGKHLMQGRFGDGTDNVIYFDAHAAAGTYMICFMTSDGTKEVRKWLVH
ncbi:MAG: hypothetical protein II970_02840 [Paludibacteraceae bacterium]|nr:hypothetical protein [Paludibacteraceae bacterium]